jgi:hypothetical protein
MRAVLLKQCPCSGCFAGWRAGSGAAPGAARPGARAAVAAAGGPPRRRGGRQRHLCARCHGDAVRRACKRGRRRAASAGGGRRGAGAVPRRRVAPLPRRAMLCLVVPLTLTLTLCHAAPGGVAGLCCGSAHAVCSRHHDMSSSRSSGWLSWEGRQCTDALLTVAAPALQLPWRAQHAAGPCSDCT